MTAYYAEIAESGVRPSSRDIPEFGLALRRSTRDFPEALPVENFRAAGSVEVEQILPAVLCSKDWSGNPIPEAAHPLLGSDEGFVVRSRGPYCVDGLLSEPRGHSAVIVSAAASTSSDFNPTFFSGQIGRGFSFGSCLPRPPRPSGRPQRKVEAHRSGADLMTRTSLSYLFPATSRLGSMRMPGTSSPAGARSGGRALSASVNDGTTLKQLIKIEHRELGIFPATESWARMSRRSA